MNIPVVVTECTSLELKHFAIAAYARGTPTEMVLSTLACFKEQENMMELKRKMERNKSFEAWFKYLH